MEIEKIGSHKKRKATQVIGCRVSKDQWHKLEVKCLEKRVPMSAILQQAVKRYISKN